MAVTPDDFLAAARKAAGHPGEVYSRAGASRAYFAAYHRCRQIALRLGLKNPGVGSHAEIIYTLQRAAGGAGIRLQAGGSKQRLAEISSKLRRCRAIRVAADYRLDETFALGRVQSMPPRRRNHLRSRRTIRGKRTRGRSTRTRGRISRRRHLVCPNERARAARAAKGMVALPRAQAGCELLLTRESLVRSVDRRVVAFAATEPENQGLLDSSRRGFQCFPETRHLRVDFDGPVYP